MALRSVPKNRRDSAANPHSQDSVADVAYREITRLWQAKEIVQLAAHASDTITPHDEGRPPMQQALECVAEMLQASIEALCSLNKSDAAEVANV
jgi:hypothetical protein